MKIEEAFEFLGTFGKSGKEVHDLSRIEHLLNLIGNPQKKLKFIHVAGTNGKGSVVEMLSQAFILQGYKTAQFTSPYILRYNDRIRINNTEITDEKICEYCDYIKSLNPSSECSQFEITMCIALLYFVSENVDIVIFECGLGGLLDCTNVIETPVLSIITSVNFDHTAILGNTISEIATQKAGIIKQDGKVVTTSKQFGETIAVLMLTATQKNSTLYISYLEEYKLLKSDSNGIEFEYKGEIYKTSMPGEHQMENASIVIKALEVISDEFKISDANIKEGIFKARIPGRIQHFRENIFLDGSHNPEGIEALCNFVKSENQNIKQTAIVGMINTKDYISACEELDKVFDRVICVDGFTRNTVPKEKLAEIFKEAETAENIEQALEMAEKGTSNDRIFFCGSLYLVSEVLKKLK